MNFQGAFVDEFVKIAIGGESLSQQLHRHMRDERVMRDVVTNLHRFGVPIPAETKPEDIRRAIRHSVASDIADVRRTGISEKMSPGQRGTYLAGTREATRQALAGASEPKILSSMLEMEKKIRGMKPHEKALDFEPWHSKMRRGIRRMSLPGKIALGVGAGGVLGGGAMLGAKLIHRLVKGPKKAKR